MVLGTVLKTCIVYDKNIIFAAHAEPAGAVEKLSPTDLAFADGVTSGEADDLDMIVVLGRQQCDQCGSEEHGFIIWMANEEEDALVAQLERWRK